MPLGIEKIVSGGQTGVDRAALDAASVLGIATGGWIPEGRLSEDGPIPGKYSTLREAATPDYSVRTELNVRDSDCTVVISRGELSSGSLLTFQLAEEYERPVLHLDVGTDQIESAVLEFQQWISSQSCEVLNVAGPRASSDPEIYSLAKSLLVLALADT
ncbi:MAG: hypothetical protein DWQ47_07365 [Acidobacteria bacterium]|nr:MAG: hypothetical protein DWQ32_15465 [Acidobacteriota bacterium]REJ99256.1 MAG: hypothetical protein DWQ38_14510 [Acidobacteriota bacterium]REK16023.1 MAG: hypothetical protein DWQ43_03175 [Acidobacteriota bacterium]REK43704.1 MAG: hypothetical protein DWQ47_07365 [Acidobacteriota bacterium]